MSRDDLTDVLAWLRSHACETSHLRQDSRTIEPGDLFVALRGAKVDAMTLCPVAAAKGARAVLCEESNARSASQTSGLPQLAVKDLRAKLGIIASAFYGEPSAALYGVGITGTNGKTSISHWIAALMTAAGKPCAAMGTIGCFFQGKTVPAPSLTTPDAVSTQGLFFDLQRMGAKAFAIEASSIGLVQGRLAGTRFKTAVFTNLTRDHLDYHKTFEAYEAAKALLFSWEGLENAVINIDDEAGRRMARLALNRGIRTIAYGIDVKDAPVGAEVVSASDLVFHASGMQALFSFGSVQREAHLKALGRFNIYNLLAVAGVAIASGMDAAEAFERIEALKAPPGRLQLVESSHPCPLSVVDYCHTPDAIEKAAEALHEVAAVRGGKLWILVGAGGDRDPGKRPMMGEVAARCADRVIVTSDNPRSEDPQKIAEAVHAGARNIKPCEIIIDRREAIVQTVCRADERDVILIAGKGHEDYQEIQGIKHHFSDVEVALEAANERFVRGNSHV